MTTTEISFNGVQCDSYSEADECACVYGKAIQLRDGRIFAVTEETLDELLAADVVSATIHLHEQTGRIMTVPID